MDEQHMLAVGTVTDAARAAIEEAGGRVLYVSSEPPVSLAILPYPQFEYMGSDHIGFMRIRLRGRVALLWQGHHPGPEYTSVERTALLSEDNEPRHADTGEMAAVLADMGDIDDHPF